MTSHRGPSSLSTVEWLTQTIAKHIAPTFAHRRIDSITTRDITTWAASLPAMAPPTKRGIMVITGKVLRHATRQGLIASNPMLPVDVPPMPQPVEPRFLLPAEVEKLALAIEQEPLGGQPANPFGDLIRFVAWTGLRAVEIAGMTLADIDLKRNVVVVRRTIRKVSGGWEATLPKSQRSRREVPMAPHVAELMAKVVTTHPRCDDQTASLWPGRQRGGDRHGELDWTKPHHSGPFMRYHFDPATESVGLEGLRFHDLRNTFASLCAEAGVPMVKVSRWMGHASLTTTDAVYAHLFADHSADLGRLAALAGGELPSHATPTQLWHGE